MGSTTVLVVTGVEDEHATLVIEALRQRGARALRFHTADFPTAATITAHSTDGELDGFVSYDGVRIGFDEVCSAWYRRPQEPLLPAWSPEIQRFARWETQHTLQGLWAALRCLWVSEPNRIDLASLKLPQLTWARLVGFEVPDTLITNDPAQARAFYDRYGGHVVCKTISRPAVEYADHSIGAIYTSPVRHEHLDQIDRVSLLPCQFQEHLPKHCDVRVTVFGQRVFPAEIDSQSSERTRYDSRRWDGAIQHRPHELPAALTASCVRLVSFLGLEFGAIDLVHTPDGRYVFLEINPNGQWAWIEDLTGLPLTQALVDLLVDGPDNRDLTAAKYEHAVR